MAVSLRKPTKVDLSKPPVSVPLREITPVHLIDEPMPFTERSVVPEHIQEEYTPFEEKVLTPEHIASEKILSGESPTESKVKEISGSVDDFLKSEEKHLYFPRWLLITFGVIIGLLVIGLLCCLLIFVINGTASLTAPAPEVPADNAPTSVTSVDYTSPVDTVYDIVSMLFDTLAGNPFLTLMLVVGGFFSLFSFLRRIRDDI